MVPENSVIEKGFTEQIKLIIPEGLRDGMSVSTETNARICL